MDIFQVVVEVFFIGEDGKCGGFGCFVSGRNGICLCVFFYLFFGGRVMFEFGDDVVRRRGKIGMYIDMWYGFVIIVYQYFFVDGSFLQFDFDLFVGDDFC